MFNANKEALQSFMLIKHYCNCNKYESRASNICLTQSHVKQAVNDYVVTVHVFLLQAEEKNNCKINVFLFEVHLQKSIYRPIVHSCSGFISYYLLQKLGN